MATDADICQIDRTVYGKYVFITNRQGKFTHLLWIQPNGK